MHNAFLLMLSFGHPVKAFLLIALSWNSPQTSAQIADLQLTNSV